MAPLWALCGLLVLLGISGGRAQGGGSDAELLLRFRDSFANGPELLPNWTGSDCCTWTGVECQDGAVTSL